MVIKEKSGVTAGEERWRVEWGIADMHNHSLQ